MPAVRERNPSIQDIESRLHFLTQLGLYDTETARIEKQAIGLSALRNIPNSLSQQTEGPYPFTHSTFYATRFGLRAVAFSPAQARDAAAFMEIALCRAFSDMNLDVALEIVLAGICLHGRLSIKEILVVESALSLIEEKGYLRSPEGEKTIFGDDAADQEWESCYHTMAVMGILLMKLASDRQPISFDAGHAGDTRYMEELALVMDSVGMMYAAIDAGNLALAVYLFSKLTDLRAEHAPSDAVLAPIVSYVEEIIGLLGNMTPSAVNPWGLSPSEFAKILSAFAQARA